jgi:hypothetical protein
MFPLWSYYKKSGGMTREKFLGNRGIEVFLIGVRR